MRSKLILSILISCIFGFLLCGCTYDTGRHFVDAPNVTAVVVTDNNTVVTTTTITAVPATIESAKAETIPLCENIKVDETTIIN